ncbi:hypothetical protein J7E50_21535 [Pedobacter sp. ISL-68]|nr:hypothetical protein [Pedobacter sp. ISL-64]MBT2592816.1 hypothetical protein [Pedobacter sp. ISL-68]
MGAGVAEVTETFHKKYSKILHINPNTTGSGINRQLFDKWKKAYWENRSLDFKLKK